MILRNHDTRSLRHRRKATCQCRPRTYFGLGGEKKVELIHLILDLIQSIESSILMSQLSPDLNIIHQNRQVGKGTSRSSLPSPELEYLLWRTLSLINVLRKSRVSFSGQERLRTSLPSTFYSRRSPFHPHSIQLLHQSFQDYLAWRTANHMPLTLGPAMNQERLARRCFQVVYTEVRKVQGLGIAETLGCDAHDSDEDITPGLCLSLYVGSHLGRMPWNRNQEVLGGKYCRLARILI